MPDPKPALKARLAEIESLGNQEVAEIEMHLGKIIERYEKIPTLTQCSS